MTAEEMLKSNDKEIVELYSNIIYNTKGLDYLKELFENLPYTFFVYKGIVNIRGVGLYNQIKRGNYAKIKEFTRNDFKKITEGLMRVEEMINSDDKEIAEMGCTLFMKEKNTTVDQLRKMLTKFGKYNILIISNHQVELTHRIRYFNNSSIFVKDPTRTVLIDLK